ncbi:DEAD/DEAH box helicase [Lacicoccus qingdaonensis]|uniref:ATP-dependent RNA helicase CshB n=1 Tax=Lacicoccus qingdaonensis TaxID=576118 RepID=A0A1G9EWG8_9BACL|nr:DEAD/DEAH box helicase [Salinicoccus qingdaonensis]SDK80378.1 ATP-dependent RNA helicase CshB [Salinicoccus qingdaonensis]
MSHAFKRFNFDENLLKAIKSINFTHPTLVQERVIPKVQRGENVVAMSETGSGKSHAFILPILESIDVGKYSTQSIILAPTRELASQLFQMTNELIGNYKDIKTGLFIGGTDFNKDADKAKKSPQVIIGTPTRVNELMKEGVLKVHEAKTIVIDEADLMIDLGFLNDVDMLANTLHQEAQFLVFSATIPEMLQQFLEKYIGRVETIVIDQPKNKASIKYSLVPVKGDDKMGKVKQLTEVINPYIGIIFANSKSRADDLYDYLREHNMNIGIFHGGLKPRERTKEIKNIRELKYEWVIASDLAARGLDIDGASHVINFDIPKDIEFFTHRVGRVGRGQYEGVAITIYTPDENYLIDQLEKKGYHFEDEDVRQGELKPVKSRTSRVSRRKVEKDVAKNLNYKVRKPKKVKPGYKKKMSKELNELRQQERRKYSKSKRRKK